MFTRRFFSVLTPLREQTRVWGERNAISPLKRSIKVLETEAAPQKIVIDQNFVQKFNDLKTYDPFDFSIAGIKLQKYKKSQEFEKRRQVSGFNSKNVNPLDFYCLPSTLSNFLRPNGDIQPRSESGLSAKKQRALSKAVKRARKLGFLSPVARDGSRLLKHLD
ncbi:unnamed protein product [Kuraishia capsulata CBS 1993]|uniref:Small ribosomal subunit protein bS18m n=1 Tax=Kuraishia capsulata CBS 1993 TaxID=1382522 RepID=W6MGR5_9ASCO|nr:uncharacterized protein KUCA_T00001338001 [Kuraishia capsulata CBS 1993]CDK25369.1 unnamed protein product [Kuraishia capsulata CBS 1993]